MRSSAVVVLFLSLLLAAAVPPAAAFRLPAFLSSLLGGGEGGRDSTGRRDASAGVQASAGRPLLDQTGPVLQDGLIDFINKVGVMDDG